MKETSITQSFKRSIIVAVMMSTLLNTGCFQGGLFGGQESGFGSGGGFGGNPQLSGGGFDGLNGQESFAGAPTSSTIPGGQSLTSNPQLNQGALTGNSSLDATPSAGGGGSTPIDQAMLQALNQFRSQNGLGPLQANPALDRAAFKHAVDQAQRGNIGHSGSDGSNFTARAAREGSAASAENVAQGNNAGSPAATAQSLLNQYINSPGHRANMLGNHRFVGLGTVLRADGQAYNTQIFL